MNYSVNLIPEEYIDESMVKRRKSLVLRLLPMLVLAFFTVIYIYISAVAAGNQKKMEVYREDGRSGGAVVPDVGEIQSRRREYEDRLQIVGPLYHRQVTTAFITDNLIKVTPPGVLLEGFEINNGESEEAAADGKKGGKALKKVSSRQTVIVSGISPSLEPLGIYLTEVQKLPVLTDALLKEAVWDNGCYNFVITAAVAP